MARQRSLVIAALAVVVAGCASGGHRPLANGNSNVITTEEIAAQSSATNAFEVIQRLRPSFLRTRGAVHGAPSASGNRFEPVDLVVYMNDSRLGGSDNLRQIPISEVLEIRYFSAADATTKWGTGHSAGAIQIVSR